MKTNKIILVVAILTFSAQAFSQLQFTDNSMLGIGRTPSYTLDVEGTARLNGYVGINGPPAVGYPLKVTSYYGETMAIDPGDNWSGIGTSTDDIHFWYTGVDYNILNAQEYRSGSDSTIKKKYRIIRSRGTI
jgi:hypothetical protein